MKSSRNPLATFVFLFLSTISCLSLLGQPGKPDKQNFLILFEEFPGAAEKNFIRNQGGEVKNAFTIVPALSVRLPDVAIERVRNRPGVKAVEIDAKIKAHEIQNTWGVLRIGCETLHDGTYQEGAAPETGAGVRVAVVDSGIDYSHSELMWNYAGGYDFVNNDSDPADDQGHGTHVAGTVAAARDTLGVVGVAPEVDLYGLKVLDSTGSGSYSWIISALDWCVANNIHVANFSLGSDGYPGTTVEAAFANAANAGIVLVASAGNAGSGEDTVGYPAKFSSVIAVASTTSSDTRSSFSSTGPDVELAAPGSSIYSTVIGGGYGTKSGTSMAAPHVSGVAALLLGAGISDANGNGRVNDDLRLVLQSTTEDLGTSGLDNEFGYGLIDAKAAVLAVVNDPGGDPEPVFDAPSNLSGVPSLSSVTLSWMDNSDLEEGFEVQYGIKRRGRVTWTDFGVAGSDSTSFSSAIEPGTYRFRVRAFTDGGATTTAWSNEINLTIEGDSSTDGGGGKGGKGGGRKK